MATHTSVIRGTQQQDIVPNESGFFFYIKRTKQFMNEVKTLMDKTALVTGASRGLGKAVAMELAQAGAHVICTARSTRDHSTQSELPTTTIEATVDAIHETRGRAEAIMCDHTDTASVKALVEHIAIRHGKLDILVNNAWGGHDLHHESEAGENVWDEPLDQFKNMLLAGAYSDYITRSHLKNRNEAE
jgi:NAD(P)-dependent dehydrogenase (short-subunit alcohol dehydrogenase family)